MTTTSTVLEAATPRRSLPRDGGSWMPSRRLVSTKLMELSKRRGLMVVVALFIVGIPVLVLGLRLIFHAVDPARYGPAGSPGIFESLSNLVASFGFIVAAVLGATVGTTDLTEGVFRQLVITGRSRVALYLARIPAGLAILLPLVTIGFGIICLVTSFAGIPEPKSVQLNGVNIPARLDKSQLESWCLRHPNQSQFLLGPVLTPNSGVVVIGKARGGPGPRARARERREIEEHVGGIYRAYALANITEAIPAINEMVKIGLWLTLDLVIGFLAGLGLGVLIGQRTVATILMIALQIIVTPLLAANVIPYFINGQRLVVGVALDQLRPIDLASPTQGGGGHFFGGRGALGIPSMPTWAMVAVIVGWAVGWSLIGAWKMARRDA